MQHNSGAHREDKTSKLNLGYSDTEPYFVGNSRVVSHTFIFRLMHVKMLLSQGSIKNVNYREIFHKNINSYRKKAEITFTSISAIGDIFKWVLRLPLHHYFAQGYVNLRIINYPIFENFIIDVSFS